MNRALDVGPGLTCHGGARENRCVTACFLCREEHELIKASSLLRLTSTAILLLSISCTRTNKSNDPAVTPEKKVEVPPESPDAPPAPVDSHACPAGYSKIALNADNWEVAWDGSGKVVFEESTESLYLKPATAAKKSETYSALVLSKKQFTNFSAEITYTNIAATRINDPPNAWENFWLFFNYMMGSDGHKLTNYLVVKPNGAEIGRAWGETNQAFVKTTSGILGPSARYGQEVKLKVDRLENSFFGAVGWRSLAKSLGENDLYQQDGKIGLYTEDAEVRVSKVCVQGK